MKSYAIAVLSGDGIGPEIMRESQKVLEAAADSFTIDWISYPYGSAHYLKTGEALPEQGLAEISRMDAVYLGTFGSPKLNRGVIEKRLLGRLRSSLDQYAQIRPVRVLPGVKPGFSGVKPGDIDYHLVRECTEDFYSGVGGLFWKSTPSEMAVQAGVISRRGCERVMDYAYGLAKREKKGLVTSCDRADLMSHSYGLWRRVFCDVSAKNKKIKSELTLINDLIPELCSNPKRFGVIVAPNLFGDILSELSALLQGGHGLSWACEANPKGVSSYRGMLPYAAPSGRANPVGLILAGAMMFDGLGERKASERIERAVSEVTKDGKNRTRDIGGASRTEQVSGAVEKVLRR